MNDVKTQDIPVELLVEHPENSNFMNASVAKKLQRHIKQTGRYDPLVVRPHPDSPGKFQVVNGHNRLRALRALNCRTACCVVWHLDDKQTRLYLATLNRLCGKDVPERRASLLDNLLKSFDQDKLIGLLPENEKQLDQLARLCKFETEGFPGTTNVREELQIPVLLDFALYESEARELNLALDLVIDTQEARLTRSQALVRLARFYLKHHRVPDEA